MLKYIYFLWGMGWMSQGISQGIDSAYYYEMTAWQPGGYQIEGLRKARACYFKAHAFPDAERVSRQILKQEMDTTVIYDVMMGYVSAVLMGHPVHIKYWDLKLPLKRDSGYDWRLVNFASGYQFFKAGDDKSALMIWRKYLSKEQGLDSLYLQTIHSWKNPVKAGIKSAFIPGWGQWKAGNKDQAFYAFGLNMGLWAGAVAIGVWIHPLLSASWILPWSLRYYSGNIYHAVTLTQQRNAELREAFLRQVALRYGLDAIPIQ